LIVLQKHGKQMHVNYSKIEIGLCAKLRRITYFRNQFL